MRHLSAEDWSQPLPAPPVLSSGSWAPVLRTQALLHEGAKDNDGKPQDGGPGYGFTKDKAYPEKGQEGHQERQGGEARHRGCQAQGLSPEHKGDGELEKADIDAAQSCLQGNKERCTLYEEHDKGQQKGHTKADGKAGQ